MTTGSLLTDDIFLPDPDLDGGYATDSSRLLLGLMALSRKAVEAEEDLERLDSLDGIISKSVLRSLLAAVHFRDESIVRHSRQVALLAKGISQQLGWEGRQSKLMEIASLLHDIGKIGVPDNILFKPGKLSADEAELMSLHCNIGIDVLQACRVDTEVLEIIGQSHTHFNGANDEYRRSGSEVHQGARILAVADAYDSLRTEQVYRPGKTHDEIMQILTESSGTQFDGNVVAALTRWADSEGPAAIHQVSAMNDAERSSMIAAPEDALESSSLGHILSYLYVLESLYDGFFLVDSDMRFVIWSRGAEKLFGRPAKEMLNKTWTSRAFQYANPGGEKFPDHDCPMNRVIDTGNASASMVRMQHAESRWMDVELQTVPLFDSEGQLQGVAEIIRDQSRTTTRPQEFRELKLAASRDPLTNVANRGELETQLALSLAEFAQYSDAESFSLIYLDLDFFKNINETHGEAVGDRVIVETAKLIQHELYSGELVARYGDEEFAILCPDTDLRPAVKRADRLRLALSNSSMGGLGRQRVTASFGVAQAESGDSVESLLRRTTKALELAKETGRNRTHSLTNEQMMSTDLKTDVADDTPSNPFVFTNTFSACIAADMIIYKLGGFVDDNGAKLVEVTSERAVVKMGSGGLFGGWGGTEDRQPVEIHLDFGDDSSMPDGKQKAASRQVDVNVSIQPVGRVRDSKVFQNRARIVCRNLRGYFGANS